MTLSGGQKARVTLARAIYSRSDIYLLDDPLSAVDSKVAKLLFNKAIKGLLQDKTVLLATHQVQFARETDRIIVLDDGKVIADGKFSELSAQGIDMEKMFAEKKKVPKRNMEASRELSRDISILSEESMDFDALNLQEEDKGKLFSKEDPHQGAVTSKTYTAYIRNTFGFFTIIPFFILLIGTEIGNVAFNRVLGMWGNEQISDD